MTDFQINFDCPQWATMSEGEREHYNHLRDAMRFERVVPHGISITSDQWATMVNNICYIAATT